MNRRELLRGVAAACLVSVVPTARAEPQILGRIVFGEFVHLISHFEWAEMSEDQRSRFENLFPCIMHDAAYYRFRQSSFITKCEQ